MQKLAATIISRLIGSRRVEGGIEVASHRMEISISSSLLFLGHLIVLTYGYPTLNTPVSVIGAWKGDVNLQCTYDPLRGYRQVLVKWLVQHGSDPVTIFLRDSTGDHIQRAKYRGRLKVNNKVPGDVSLLLNTLQMDDRNHYTCEVTWLTPDGNRVIRHKMIELRVQKNSYNPPIINTEALTTMQSSLGDSYNLPIINTEALTTMQSSLGDSYNPPITNTEALTTLQSSLGATTILSSTSNFSTNGTEKSDRTNVGPGRKLPIFAIIFIISVCCIVVVTMAYIISRHRTFQKGYVYEVSRIYSRKTSNSEETTRVPTIASEYFNNEPDSQALINDCSDDPCLSQEYQITTRPTMTIPAY